jgi:hypothetical protein
VEYPAATPPQALPEREREEPRDYSFKKPAQPTAKSSQSSIDFAGLVLWCSLVPGSIFWFLPDPIDSGSSASASRTLHSK